MSKANELSFFIECIGHDYQFDVLRFWVDDNELEFTPLSFFIEIH